MKDQQEPTQQQSEELDIVVFSYYATSHGEFRWGPRYEMGPSIPSQGVRVGWDVTELSLQQQRVGRGAVARHVPPQEPLLCLAARGADCLGPSLSNLSQTPPRIEYVAIEVRYGDDVAAKVRAERKNRTWVCEAWAYREGCRLHEVVTASSGELAIEHLVAWLLRRLVLVEARQQSGSAKESVLRLPPPWRNAHDLPPQHELDRESLFRSWGT